IAGPLLPIIVEKPIRYTPKSRLPRQTVITRTVHNQVGGLAGEGAGVDRLPRHDRPHGERSALIVDQAGELARDRGLERLGLAVGHSPLALAPLAVEVNAPQAERVRLGAAPVDVAEHIPRVGTRLHAVAKREQAVVEEPVIEMEPAAEALEAVVTE